MNPITKRFDCPWLGCIRDYDRRSLVHHHFERVHVPASDQAASRTRSNLRSRAVAPYKYKKREGPKPRSHSRQRKDGQVGSSQSQSHTKEVRHRSKVNRHFPHARRGGSRHPARLEAVIDLRTPSLSPDPEPEPDPRIDDAASQFVVAYDRTALLSDTQTDNAVLRTPTSSPVLQTTLVRPRWAVDNDYFSDASLALSRLTAGGAGGLSVDGGEKNERQTGNGQSMLSDADDEDEDEDGNGGESGTDEVDPPQDVEGREDDTMQVDEEMEVDELESELDDMKIKREDLPSSISVSAVPSTPTPTPDATSAGLSHSLRGADCDRHATPERNLGSPHSSPDLASPFAALSRLVPRWHEPYSSLAAPPLTLSACSVDTSPSSSANAGSRQPSRATPTSTSVNSLDAFLVQGRKLLREDTAVGPPVVAATTLSTPVGAGAGPRSLPPSFLGENISPTSSTGVASLLTKKANEGLDTNCAETVRLARELIIISKAVSAGKEERRGVKRIRKILGALDTVWSVQG